MLAKSIMFVFVVLGFFGVLMALMPYQFNVSVTSPTYQQKLVEEYFSANDLIIYNNTSLDNMTYTYSSLTDAPSPPQWSMGLPTDQYLEVWWSQFYYGALTKSIILNHVKDNGFWGYGVVDRLKMFYQNGTQVQGAGYLVNNIHLVSAWSTETNSSVFSASCSHLSAVIVFMPHNSSLTIQEAWDSGEIDYYFSYEIDWSKQDISVWNIITDLLLFRRIDLGIGGTAGTIINYAICSGIWALILYAVIRFILALIPLISGLGGD